MAAVPQSQYFSLREFLLLSWRYKWFIAIVTGLFAVLSVVIAIKIPNQYKAVVKVSASEEQQGGGLAALANQFGSLASLAGINIDGKSGNNMLLTLEVLKSRQFIMRFIERHQTLLPLMAAKSWDMASGELQLDDSIYDVSTKKWVRQVKLPFKPKPSLIEAYEAFRERLVIDRDSKSGVVGISFEFYSPVLAQQWLTLMVKDLNDYMRKVETEESQRSIEYLQAQIKNTQLGELKNVFFQLIQEQTKKAMLAQVRQEFSFKTIDAAIVPEKKSKPSRALICIIITLLGGVLALFAVHLRQAVLNRPTI